MENKSDDKFYQYYKSFLQDIIISFPEYKDSIIENHASLLRTNYPVSEKKRAKCNKWRETVFKYCLDNGKLIAEKNSEVFTKEEAKKCLGRNIEFNSIWTSNITESTREQLWNYLQTFYMLAVSDNTDSDLSSLFKNFSETLEGDSTTNEAMMANLKNITENMLETMKDESTELTPKDIEEIGLTQIAVKERFEGSNLSFNSILPVIQLSTKMGIPLPLTETIISNYLFSELDIKPPNGMVTFAIESKNIKILNGKISGNLFSVPYLNLTDQIIIIQDIDGIKKFIFIKNIDGEKEAKKNFLSEPRYNLNIENCKIIEIKELNKNIDFNQIGSIIRSAQMVGAMEKVIDLSIEYCSQRVQFGRSLSKFQAIQHQISEMAVELSASTAALSTLTNTDELDFKIQDVAVLKIRAGIAAGKLIAMSHQVHGAMGFTKEYELAYFTRNLNSWRNDFGNETYWQNILGKHFLEKNNLNLWEYLTN